jgi:superfamily II DNA or RNA helicase
VSIILRQHQDKCIHTLLGYPDKYAVAEVAVAGGKSLILGCLAGYNTTGRTLIIAHTKELVQQNADACRSVGIKPGICSASLGKNVFAKVTVGTVQTIVRRTRSFQDVTLILVDEVHRTPVNKTSSYRKIFEAIPHAKVRGLTGTPFRADGTGSLEKTFGPIIFKYSFLDALQDGYVKPLVPAHSEEAHEISTEGIHVKGEDFDMDEMAPRAIQLSKHHATAIKQTMERQGRKCVLVFACNTEHADKLEKELNAIGVRAASVHSKSPAGKRDKMVSAFKSRVLPVLVSVAMFDTGFNAVDIDLLAFCRATKSPVFFAQALGRGARLTPYAENCAVLDFGGNVKRHGSLDTIAAAPGVELQCDPWDAPSEACGTGWETWRHGRTCPSCEAVHKSATKCKGCEARFDQFYHGNTCPHCGLLQASVKVCNACSQNYAAFLHPICPSCGYDNTSVQNAGKDLSEWGGSDELVSTSAILKANPWQPITRPPFKGSTHWQLPTKYATVKWPYGDLPADIAHVYLVKAGNGHLVVKAWYDKKGVIHQL